VSSGGRSWRVVLPVAAIVLVIAFWTWALLFASREAVNKIGDRAWAQRAQDICERADTARQALADFRVLEPDDPAMLAERGALVDRATEVTEHMLDDVVSVEPSDAKGQAIVPQWEADYRRYLADRRQFAADLRAGRNEAFAETAVDGIPISEKLGVFAADNQMPACGPPHDLAS
jgi:hypothetical protein